MAKPDSALPFLPYGRQWLDDDDLDAVRQVLESDWLTTGPAAENFEAALRSATGAEHAVVCSSGTAALHLATRALGLRPGDAVIVPALTFAAAANMARLEGLEVIFADIDPDSGLMGVKDADAALQSAPDGKRVKAVCPVHLNGQISDPQTLAEFAEIHGLAVIEDVCHALGGRYQDQQGNWHQAGDNAYAALSCFSFHPVKAIAMGEGGAVTTADAKLAHQMRQQRSHGIARGSDMRDASADEPWQYEVQQVGLNYRASDIHCALGASQLNKLDQFIDRRRAIVNLYETLLAPLAPLVRPIARVPGCQPAWHLFVAQFDFAAIGIPRQALMEALHDRGIGSQVHYIPLHQQPYYQTRYGPQNLPGAEDYYRKSLSLPLFPKMTDGDVERVVVALKDIIA